MPACSVTLFHLLSMRPTLALILPVGFLKLGLEETENPADLLCSLKLSTSCKL